MNRQIPVLVAFSVAFHYASAQSFTSANSPGEAIVYTTLRPPNLDIYLFERPGGLPRRLTDHPALDYNASFSPDGRWLVFTSERNGNVDLYALDLEGGGTPVRLTTHPGLDDAASFDSDGRRLAFVSTRDGDADIFVMAFVPGEAAVESRAVNLTRSPGGDFNPVFAPDGRRIAFARQDALWGARNGNEPGADFGVNVYVMDVDGSNVRALTKPGSGLEFRPASALPLVSGSPAWALDNRALYYHRIGREGAEIRRVSVDGLNDTLIVRGGMSPSVGSDGRIAFARPQPRPGLDEFDTLLRTGALFSVGADGGDLRQESDLVRSYFAPAFQPAKARIVAHGPGPVTGLVTVGDGAAFAPPDTQRRAVLPDRSIEVRGIRGYFPALTSDGDVLSSPLHLLGGDRPLPLHISASDGTGMRPLFTPPSGAAWGAAVARTAGVIVVAAGPPFAPGEARVDIWRLRLDGTEAVNLTGDAPANNALPHISAAAERIVFRIGGSGSGRVYVMDGDGKQRRRLTDATAVETMPALSPDGEWVVFPTDRAGGRKLWLQRFDGSSGRFLEPDRLHIPDLALHPRFSPDGKWVVFTSNRAGFNDEWPLTWFPQPYGELFAVPVAGGGAVRLTDDKWEDGPSDWGYVRPSTR